MALVLPLTHPLKHPVVLGPATVRELVFSRRLRGKDLREIEPLSAQATTLKVIEQLTGQPAKIVDELDAEDLADLEEVVASFFPEKWQRKGEEMAAALVAALAAQSGTQGDTRPT
jgi:hypothetical protein